MIIYLVNRNSKFKGPFDIIGSNRQHIIKVGDICLRDTHDGVDFLLVTNSNNSWNACKRVGKGANSELSELGNTLLFSFDGLHKRNGNILLINQLSYCFREKVIVDFFRNAIDILEYKTDFWDASLFVQLLASSQELISRKDVKEPNNKPITKPSSTKPPSIFAQYFNDDLQKHLINYINEGKDLKEAYLLLRDKDPSSFRSALLKFLIENPDKTIFDKLSFTDNQAPVELESDNENETPIQEVVHEVEDSNPYIYDEKSYNEFIDLLFQYRHGDRKALDLLVEKNMRLVELIARSYKDRGAQYEDLVQEGIIGLMSALERFDPSRKVPFAFYAKWWINQAILTSLITMQTMIKIPANQRTLYNKIKKEIERFEQEHGHAPSANEIELDVEIDPQNLKYLLSLPDNILELTSGKADLDTIPSSDSSSDDKLIKESKAIFVESIIRKLNKRESQILRAAYGIGVEEKDLSEIGERYGLSRERVRQIKEKAVKKLRDFLKYKRIIKGESEDCDSLNESQDFNDEIRKNHVKKTIEIIQNFRNEQSDIKKQVERIISNSIIKDDNIENIPSAQKDDPIIGKVIAYDLKRCKVINKKRRGSEERLIVEYEDGTIDDVKFNRKRIVLLNESHIDRHVIQDKAKVKNVELVIEDVYVDTPSADPYFETEVFQNEDKIDNKTTNIKNYDYSKIHKVFEKRVTSYKYFWFMAIISLIKEKGEKSISFKDILIRMVALAWPIVLKKNINLGKQDMLAKYLEEITNLTDLNRSSNVWYINSHLEKQYDRVGLDVILSPLLNNVPYRFLSPWIKFTTTQDVVEQSKKMFNDCIYALYTNSIVLNPVWFDYICTHYKEICNFTINSFLQYAMIYNDEIDVKKLNNKDWELLSIH